MTVSSLSTPRPTGTTLVVSAAVAALLAAAFIWGREARIKADAAEAITIGQENEAFCGHLGFSPGASIYATCVNGLSDIRRRQKERYDLDAAGVL